MRPKQSVSVSLYLVVAVFLCAVQQARCEEVSQFHLAISKGELAKVKQLISNDPTIVNHRNEYKFTPLFTAAHSGHTAIAKLLLDQGAKIEARVQGQTPLYAACDNGHSKTAALLLDRGADPNAARTGKEAKGETPLDIAIHGFHKGAVKTLLDHGANSNLTTEEYKAAAKDLFKQPRQIPLHAAFLQIRHARHWKNLKKGDKAKAAEFERLSKAAKEIARMLIAHKKTNVTARHPHGGVVALHLATMIDCPDLAKLLLARGVDVNVRTTKTPWLKRASRPPDYAFNETPLHFAVRAEHDDMVQFLLKHGADREARNSLGQTPFDIQPAKR
jgi:ankyrin repeat protein